MVCRPKQQRTGRDRLGFLPLVDPTKNNIYCNILMTLFRYYFQFQHFIEKTLSLLIRISVFILFSFSYLFYINLVFILIFIHHHTVRENIWTYAYNKCTFFSCVCVVKYAIVSSSRTVTLANITWHNKLWRELLDGWHSLCNARSYFCVLLLSGKVFCTS